MHMPAKLNNPQAVKLIDQTLAEEKKTDEALTKIAETAVNYEAKAQDRKPADGAVATPSALLAG
jgi:ferritin-like metal-binding protein YciE